MAREIYASDGVVTLYRLAEEDREALFTLYQQCSDTPEFYEKQRFRQNMWKSAMDPAKPNFSVYDENGEYCGNLELQKPDAPHPEIGIDLLRHKRYQGIGGRAVKLLAKTDYTQRRPEYYLLTVKPSNTASIRMIEKLGAVRTDEISEKAQEQKNILRMLLSFGCSEELRTKVEAFMQELEDLQVYHLLAESFAD